jgi:hypothetical protein
MIEHGIYVQEGPPMIVADKRAILPCGCFATVGLRSDTHEASVGGGPCSRRHARLMERFSLALTDSLVNPTRRPLIDVVDEILTEVSRNA